MKVRLAEMRWPEVEEILQDPTPNVLFLPVGSTEQHGPHNPVNTDIAITMRFLAMVMVCMMMLVLMRMLVMMERFGLVMIMLVIIVTGMGLIRVLGGVTVRLRIICLLLRVGELGAIPDDVALYALPMTASPRTAMTRAAAVGAVF